MDLPRADLDSPWQEILRAYFPQVMQFFFPNTAALIDWKRSREVISKKFQMISRDANVGNRSTALLLRYKEANAVFETSQTSS